MAGTEEGMRKGNTPKEDGSCDLNLGHAAKNRMTVIQWLDGVLSQKGYFAPALCSPAFLT